MKPLSPITALLLAAVLAGCGGGDGTEAPSGLAPKVAAARQTPPPETGAGSIRVTLSGASGCGFEHVWVTVRAVRIYRTDPAADSDASPSELTLSPPRRIDLVGVAGGLLAELGTIALPAGHYQALRLVLAENGRDGTPDALSNAVQVNGASPTPLATPAAAQSGIKVPLNSDVAAGQTADALLAFDPCTSVVQAGNSGRYILKPVISAAPLVQGFVAQPARLVGTTAARSDLLVAALANGGYVIIWNDSPRLIRAQIHDGTGSAVGGDLPLYQGAVASAATGLPNGGFAVAAVAEVATNIGAVLALQFDPSGAAVGTPRIVLTAGEPYYPMWARADDIDALPDGGYLVTGAILNPRPPVPSGSYVVGRFDSTGASVGGLIPVSSGGWGWRSTSVLTSGGWVTAFAEMLGVFAPRPFNNTQSFVNVFDASGGLVATTTINPYPGADEGSPVTAASRYGDYLVAWRVSPFVEGLPLPQVQLQLFDQSGTAAGGIVDFDPPVSVRGLKLTALADGGFLLSFEQAGPSNSVLTVLGQYFDATGHASGPTFELGPFLNAYGVAATADGGFVFTNALPSTGSGETIYVTAFKPAAGL